MQMIGEHHVDILSVLPAKHRIQAIDFSGKERHALVLDGRAIQRDEFEAKKIGRLEELGQNHFSVVRGISRIVSSRAVLVVKEDKAGILDPVALGRSDWEQNPLGQARLLRELHFIIGSGEHQGFSGYTLGRFPFSLRELCCSRSEEHTSELQSLRHLVCRLLLEKKKQPEHQWFYDAVLRSLLWLWCV